MAASVKEYQVRISAVDAGASALFKKVGGDTRKEIEAVRLAALKPYDLRGGGSSSRGGASYQVANAAAGSGQQTTIKDVQAVEAARAKARAEMEANAARVDRAWEAASFDKYKEEERAKKDAASGGPLKGLRDTFGRGSTFGTLSKAVAGGGAIFGLSLAAREVDEVTGKIKNLAEEFHHGRIAAGQIPDELAKSIPILSSLRGAVENIYDISTAQGRADVQARENMAAYVELANFQGERLTVVRDRSAEILSIQLKMKSELGQIGLLGGARERAGITGQAAVDAHNDEAEAIKSKADVTEKYSKIAQDYQQKKGDQFRSSDPVFLNLMAGKQKELDQIDAQAKASAKKREEVNKGLTAESDERSRKAFEAQAREGDQANFQKRGEVAKSDAKYLGRVPEEAIAAAAEERKRAIIEIDRKAQQDADEAKRSGATKSQIAGIGSRAEEAKSLERAKEQQKVRDIQRQHIQDMGEVESRLRQNRISGIEQELEGDYRVNEQEKFRLEIEEKFAQKRRELNDLLLSAHESQRQAVQDQIDALDAQEAAAQEARGTLALEEDKLRLLQEQARYGNAGAKAELDRVEAAKRYREEVQRLQGIIISQAGTPAAAEASKRLAGLAGVEAQRVGKGLEDISIRQLQQQGSAGNRAARILAAKFEAAKQFKDQKAQLESVLSDPAATAEQKAAAKQMLAALPGVAQQVIGRAGAEGGPFSPTAGTVENAHGGNAGITGKAREDAFLRQAQQQNKAVEQSNAYLKGILEALQRNIKGPPAAFLD